jgi:hypothetical protein
MAANQRQTTGGPRGRFQSGSPIAESPARQFAHEMGEQASGYLSRGASQVREMTRDREGTAVVAALAAGFGVGLLVGGALASSHRRQPRWRDRIAAEGLGRRVLERVEGMVPDALTGLIHR